MIVNVRLFARARDLVGEESLSLTLPPGARVADLRLEMVDIYPQLAALTPHLFIAIDNDYVDDNTQIPENASIACFPPVSGG